MAGRKEFELLFKLQAALGSGFNSSFRGAMNTTKQLKSNLSKINSLSGKIDGFQKQSAALQANKDKLAKLTEEHDRLQKEMSQTEQPSEALRQKMERNARQIEQTTAKIKEQETRLGQLGSELSEAGINTDRLSQENDKLAKSYEKIKKNQEKLAHIAEAQQKNNEAIAQTKSQLTGTLGAFAAVGAAIYAGPVQKSMEFQTSMAKVGTIADQNVVPLSQMQKEIINLSNSLGVNANAVADDVYNAISAGQNTADAVGFVEKATMLAKGGFAETGQALDVLTTILNAYGKKSSEAESVSNMLITTQNRGKVTVAELSSVMGKIIPTANANKVSLEQLCAGYSIMTARGIAAAETTTYMNSMLNELGKSGTTADKTLRAAAGGSFSELMAQGNSLADVLNILQTEAQKGGKTLSDMFGSAEAGKAALTLMANGVDGFNSEVSAMVDSTGAAQAAYEKMMNTTAAKVEKAKVTLSNLAIVLGDTFLPYVTKAADKLAGLVTKFSEWAQENPELLSTVVKVGAALAGLTVGAQAGKLGFLEIKSGVLSVMGAFSKIKALGASGGLKALFSGFGGIGGKLLPIAGIIGGIGLAIKLISGNLEEVRSWIRETFGDGALAVFDKVWGVIQNVGAAIKGVFSGENIGNARSFFQDTFGDAGGAIFDSLMGAITQLQGILPGLFEQFSQLGATLLPRLLDLFGQIAPMIGEFVASVLPLLVDMIAQILPVIGQIVEAVLPVLIELIQMLLPIIMQVIKAVLPVLQGLLESIVPVIQMLAETILPLVLGLIRTVINALMPLIEMILPYLQQLLEMLIPVIQAMAEQFSVVLATAINAISGILEGLTQILQGLINFITGVFTGNWTQAWEGVKQIFSGIWQSIKSICVGVVNGIISVINTVISGLNALKIPDWVPGIGGKGIINIPLIPMLAKGSRFTPDTFIAGEKGAELVTNARGRTVFTAAQTGKIFENINTARETQAQTTVVTLLPLMQAALMAARTNAGGVEAPTLTAAAPQGGGIVIHSAPVFNVGSDAQAEELEEMLNRRDEELLDKIDERQRQQEDDERRRNYD